MCCMPTAHVQCSYQSLFLKAAQKGRVYACSCARARVLVSGLADFLFTQVGFGSMSL